MKLPFRLFLLILIALLLWQCSDSGTNPPNPQLTFSADAGVIEAWLSIAAEDADGMEVRLTRDGAERMRFFAVAETTVVDTGLLPNHSYTYRAELLHNGKTTASQSLTLTTMDTTSHHFQWEIVEFPSPFGSGGLRDVAIINANDIWAVGAIAADSAQPWLPYNAVHWDGQEWELLRIPFIGPCSAVDYPPLRAVWAFDEQTIYFSNGGSIVQYDGNNFTMDCGMNSLLYGAIEKIWGSDTNNMYAVGGSGTIVHYNGQGWQRIESGTDLDFQDIWGARHNATGEWQVIALASKPLVSTDKLIMQLEPQVSLLADDGIGGFLQTTWFSPDRKYYLAGSGVYRKYYLSQPTWESFSQGLPNFYRESIRGSGLNDIFLVGHLGLVSHWNGANWHSYPGMPGKYLAVAIKENLVLAVGSESAGFAGGAATILMGKRN